MPHLISYLSIINVLALPYSFWSVWHQKFKARQWCVLCLIVQALFWLVFSVEWMFGYLQLPEFNTINGLFIACLFVLFILTANILIPKLSKGRMVSYLKQEISSIKANVDVFRALLTKRPHYGVNKSDSQIRFGNPEAQLQIILLSNPYCNPCALMHRRMEKFLESVLINGYQLPDNYRMEDLRYVTEFVTIHLPKRHKSKRPKHSGNF